MKTRKPIARATLVVGLLLGPACSQIIGIQDAHVDETIGVREPSGAGSSAISGSLASPSAGAGGAAEPEHNHGGTKAEPTPTDGGRESSGGSEPGDSGAGGAEPDSGLCERYCDEITTNCKGKYEQYRSYAQCIRVCKRLPPGQDGDDNVNSVNCRVKQAGLAKNEDFLYCKSAGPLGGGRCGSNCSSYCSLMDAACTAESTALNSQDEASHFDSYTDCMDACNAIPPDEAGPVQYSSSSSATPSTFVGDNVYCRTFHVAAAIEDDTADEHCPHAMGGYPCNPEGASGE